MKVYKFFKADVVNSSKVFYPFLIAYSYYGISEIGLTDQENKQVRQKGSAKNNRKQQKITENNKK